MSSEKPLGGAIQIINAELSEKELRRLARAGKKALAENRNQSQRAYRQRKKYEAEDAALAGSEGQGVSRAWIERKLKQEAEDPESKPTDRIAALDKLAKAHGLYSENSGVNFMLNINILDPEGKPTEIVHAPRDVTPAEEGEDD